MTAYQKKIIDDQILQDERVEYVKIEDLTAGNIFGELNLIYNFPSLSMIKCDERCRLLKIPKATFDKEIKDFFLQEFEMTMEFYQ